MTVDVDTDTFYAVGGRLFELAGEVYDAFAVNVGILGGTGAMGRHRRCGHRVGDVV
jgi:hypothetical protein